jgi:hypothetical protein
MPGPDQRMELCSEQIWHKVHCPGGIGLSLSDPLESPSVPLSLLANVPGWFFSRANRQDVIECI